MKTCDPTSDDMDQYISLNVQMNEHLTMSFHLSLFKRTDSLGVSVHNDKFQTYLRCIRTEE